VQQRPQYHSSPGAWRFRWGSPPAPACVFPRRPLLRMRGTSETCSSDPQ
jgi:hypothetical protein